MWKIWPIGALFLCMTGCATLDESLKNYQSCVADPACVQQVKLISDATSLVANTATAGTDFPSSVPLNMLLTLATSFGAGIVLGKKLNKPKLELKVP